MDNNQFEDLKEYIQISNISSSFQIKIFDSGAYFQVTNSRGQVHELGFEALKEAFLGLLKNYREISHYIERCNRNPSDVDSSFDVEKANFLKITSELRKDPSQLLEANIWKYKEKPLRVISEHYFSNSRISVIGKEQSKLFFNTISRMIHFAKKIAIENDEFDSQFPFAANDIEIGIDAIINILEKFEAAIKSPAIPSVSKAGVGHNIIYYGAPGTGKSNAIDKEVNESNSIRTVFHSDTQNSDFVGCLKPKMEGGSVIYEFRAGPFTCSVINAINNPENHHWLIIEEINRAPAAAVFGEIFQLLDRDSDTGKSIYGITLSDPDMALYIEKRISEPLVNNKLYLPSNLTLLATMNSSDQAVMPLDTAFKRRWRFRYIPLDFDVAYNNSGKACAEGDLIITGEDNSALNVSWKNFAVTVNNILAEKGIPEDRHLGPFFLSEAEMEEDEQKEALTGKLFMYLWDDVLRHGMTEFVFDSDIKTYGALTRNYNENKKVFSDNFYQALNKTISDNKGESEETREVQSDDK